MSHSIALTLFILVAAFLYSSVGHGGASGYLASMALFGVAPEIMKPSALVLNLFVAGLGTARYARAGCFSWKIFWPFAVISIPCSFIGGKIHLPGTVYKVLLGAVLLFAAFRLAIVPSAKQTDGVRPIYLPTALGFGALIGLLAGLTGVGGGIFLSPLLLFFGWAEIRTAAGVSSAFILVNSIAGLLGDWQSVRTLPHDLLWWAPAAVIGGIIGTELGTRRLSTLAMRRMLAAVMVIAGAKLLISH
jgi:uncharacterized membrane protein YfcA